MRQVTLIGDLPMTPEIFSDVFQALNYGAIFVNTVREPLVVYRALASGCAAGAALEAIAVEPLRSELSPLGCANVVLAPHFAGASIRAVRNSATGVAEEMCHSFSGERRLHYC